MSFVVKRLAVGQLTTNCYLVVDADSSEALIIDPGDAAEYIINTLSDHDAQPVQIIATHGHFDHILAATELRLAYNIPFLMHAKDTFLIARMQQSARHFLGIKTDPPPAIDGFLPDTAIRIGKHELAVIETPGHTPGSICVYNKTENILFCGDTIFADGGVGRTDFSYSNSQQLVASIKTICNLPAKTTLYPGHGRATSIAHERDFHRCAGV